MTAELADDFEICRRIHSRHGRTYYLASQMLPIHRRKAIHALYAFARQIDDVVDVDVTRTPSQAHFDRMTQSWREALAGHSDDPVLRATAETVHRFGIDPQWLDDFLASMRLDLTRHTYATWTELSEYTWGSASVIGLQTATVMGISGDERTAHACAARLGEAFQLTNFIRDYDEDRLRGRIYLPTEEFTAHGIAPGSADSPALRALIKASVERAEELYDAAQPGIALLRRSAQPCCTAAFVLYRGILDEIRADGYRVIGKRHAVPRSRRLRTAGPLLLRALLSRDRA